MEDGEEGMLYLWRFFHLNPQYSTTWKCDSQYKRETAYPSIPLESTSGSPTRMKDTNRKGLKIFFMFYFIP